MHKRHPDDLKRVDVEWVLGPTPELPRRLTRLGSRYVGFDGEEYSAFSPDDPLTKWLGQDAAYERFNLVISWPTDGASLEPWIHNLSVALDRALGLVGRFATPEDPSEPKERKEPAETNTPAVSPARRGNSGKRVRHYDCKACGHQWNQRTEGEPLLCRRCKASCIPTYAKDRTTEQIEAFKPQKCGVEWCAKPVMPGQSLCNGPCRTAADLEAIKLAQEGRLAKRGRQKQIDVLKERCKAVERRFEARGIKTEPAVTEDGKEMAVRFISIRPGAPLHEEHVDKVWTLTKCEEWLDSTPLKQ